jgi:hypothetical protein
MNMIDEQIKRFADELARLGGNACKQDIIRRMKCVSRLTATFAEQIILEQAHEYEIDKLFQHTQEPTKYIEKAANNVMNTFLS